MSAGTMRSTTRIPDAPVLNLENPGGWRSKIVVAITLSIASSGLIVLGSTDKPRDEPSTRSLAETLPLTTPVSAQTLGSLAQTASSCGDCHAMDPIFSHPIDIHVSSLVSDHLVLDQGLMTCTTCHTDADYERHDRAIQAGDPMLRLPADQLCITCHVNEAATRRSAHASMQRQAHSQTPKARDDRQAVSLANGLDTASRQCLACHDGMIAADAGAGLRLSSTMFSTNHPVGMEYPSDLAAGRLSLHTRDTRDARIRLVDGVVGCSSCHSLYSDHRRLLVIDNDESQLCMACHNL